MDFASLMKSQISSGKAGPKEGDKKYLKRSDLEDQRRAQYERAQEELERTRLERLERKRKLEEEDAERNAVRELKKKKLAEESRKHAEEEALAEEKERRRRLGLPDLDEKHERESGTPLADGEDDIPEDELLARLRDLDEPAKVFGETHIQRLRRYRKIINKAPAKVMSKGPIPTSILLLPEAEMRVPSSVPKDATGRDHLIRQLASYFDMVLREWEVALARRPNEVKLSHSGRQAANSYTAAKTSLIPLFTKLESNDLPNAIMAPVLEIVDLAQQKRYVHANDAYLRLSIGKAAWPIGVTMVGIHERSAREKLHESEKGGEKAHIMTDEATRKMLQGIKRCLSFAQTRWPPEDIGQMMG